MPPCSAEFPEAAALIQNQCVGGWETRNLGEETRGKAWRERTFCASIPFSHLLLPHQLFTPKCPKLQPGVEGTGGDGDNNKTLHQLNLIQNSSAWRGKSHPFGSYLCRHGQLVLTWKIFTWGKYQVQELVIILFTGMTKASAGQ